MRVLRAGTDRGVVALRASAIPVPRDPDARPWWIRGAWAVAGALDRALFGILG